MPYGESPVCIGSYESPLGKEAMCYQYMLVKPPGTERISMDPRLTSHFGGLVGRVMCDFIGRYGLDRFVSSHVYITAKCRYTSPEAPMNRTGWHCDGFGTDDVNYVWCDFDPTEFMVSGGDVGKVPADHVKSVDYFDSLEREGPVSLIKCPPGSVLLLSPLVIHRVSASERGMRTFVKISVSRDRYPLRGNTLNHDLLPCYEGWEWVDRVERRNDPAGRN